MSSTLSADDISCFLYVPILLTCWLVHHCFPGWYYILWALFFKGIENFSRTRAFILAIFCCLIAKDVWNAFLHAAQPWVPGPIKEFFRDFPQSEVQYASHVAELFPAPAPFNKTLQRWIDEDGDEACKLKRRSREAEAVRRQEIRERWLAIQEAEREDVD